MDSPWLVAIVGPAAVGKMTVGQQLAARTGFALYHNHHVIDHLTPFFEYGSPPFERLVTEYRRRFFEEAASAGLGIVATWGWWFDHPDEQPAVEHLIEPFLDAGGQVSFVELAAPLDVRLARNQTDNRRAHKRLDWATEEALSTWDGGARTQHDRGAPVPVAGPPPAPRERRADAGRCRRAHPGTLRVALSGRGGRGLGA